MFSSESCMTQPTIEWMRSLGLFVRPEFITPWGKCDLVGVSFRKKSIRDRLRYGQTQAVTSLIGGTLLLRIPDIQTGESVRLSALATEYSGLISEHAIAEHTERLITQKFVRQSSNKGLQKLNGWFPLCKKVMAVELKLNRIEEAMTQAMNNLNFAQESYVGLPSTVALRLSAKRDRWAKYIESGVGLLGITPASCDIVIRSRRGESKPDDVLQFCSVEKFWRSYLKAIKH